MIDLDMLSKDGFGMDSDDGMLSNLALLSLRIALKAFFSTHATMRYGLHVFEQDKSFVQERADRNYPYSYNEACSETIVHFQHFAELVCKDILRQEHELLAVDASDRPVILYKLLNGEKVLSSDLEGLKSVEFSVALKRLCQLIDEEKLDVNKYGFIKDHRRTLEKLNVLRNRMWHRGTFILRYPALDQLVGKFILPFVCKVLELDSYTGRERIWKYKPLSCAVDPLQSIIQSFQSEEYRIKKIAILKELGRAAYINPLDHTPFIKYFNDLVIKKAERIAYAEEKEYIEGAIGTKECPVCGIHSLNVYEDTIVEGDPCDVQEAWRFTSEVKCTCCTFEINHHLDNPSIYGLPLEDYWIVNEL